MLYMIVADDKPDALSLRRATRAAHLDYARALAAAGRLRFAGPRPRADSATPTEAGFHGSLIIGEFPSLAAAEAWAAEDPYAKAGLFERVLVQPLIQVLPE